VSALHNGQLAALLLQAASEQDGHRRLALERAAKEAWRWPEEASALAADGRSLTELTSVGPWVAQQIHDWLDAPPPVPELDETRRGYLTFAQVRAALELDPGW
jgi:hypothetical protein